MRTTILLIFILSCIISCNPKTTSDSNSNMEVNNTPRPFEIHLVEGYFLKNTILLQDDINYMVFNTQKEFDAYFGMAKTMNNPLTSIDFTTERVAAILIASTDFLIEFTVINSILTEKGVQMTYSLTKGEKQSFLSSPLYLFKIPKDTSISSVEFIHKNDHNTITFPFK